MYDFRKFYINGSWVDPVEPRELERVLRDNGFRDVASERLTLGVARLYWGTRE